MIFGNLGKMGEVLQKAKQLKDEIARARYEAEVKGVKVVVNGDLEIVELKVPQGLTSSQLESAVKEAVNRVLKTAKADMAQKLGKITGGMGLPGIP
jgi:DNA-binding protein YbaB